MEADGPDVGDRLSASPTGTIAGDHGPAPSWSRAVLPRRDGRYLAAVALSAVVAMAALGTTAGATRALWAYLALGAWASLIGAADAVTGHIANKANGAALLSGLVLLAVASSASPSLFGRVLLGAALSFVAYFLLWAVAPAAMGMGDVKLAPYLGAHLAYVGWTALVRGLVFGFLAQAAMVVMLLAIGRINRRTHVPHGPAMCIGAIASLVLAAAPV